MSIGNIAYLALVVGSFSIFALVLAVSCTAYARTRTVRSTRAVAQPSQTIGPQALAA